jgi:diaminopimelate decarboxylase
MKRNERYCMNGTIGIDWRNGLAPGHERDGAGELYIGGTAASELARAFGTPALILDMRVLDAALDTALAAAVPHGIAISYAAKALWLTALAQYLRSTPIGIDVCSLGELVTAERGGIEPRRLTLHGAGKTVEEIEAALEGRVGRIVVDSLEELHTLCERAGGRSLDVLLRLNTGIEAHTHDFVRTAGDDSKFGLAPRDEPQAIAMLRDRPNLRVAGVHGHIGSQIYDDEPFVSNAGLLLEALDRLRSAGFDPGAIVIGGGFGVPANPESTGESFDIAHALERIGRVVPRETRVEIEPGRALIAAAGTSLYCVLAIKCFEKRRFAIVDGSMSDNPRPALYGAYHHVTPVRASRAALRMMTVCGRSCENDQLAEVELPDDLRAGDLLAVCTTGAYTYSMASNYNRFARPPVVAAGKGAPRLFARRETLEDLLRADMTGLE